ncbi:unnamed protein product [Closterium sp. Naga37s-1]|nr:unnamed protein product [Closterium sp. Naga37s-1]
MAVRPDVLLNQMAGVDSSDSAVPPLISDFHLPHGLLAGPTQSPYTAACISPALLWGPLSVSAESECAAAVDAAAAAVAATTSAAALEAFADENDNIEAAISALQDKICELQSRLLLPGLLNPSTHAADTPAHARAASTCAEAVVEGAFPRHLSGGSSDVGVLEEALSRSASKGSTLDDSLLLDALLSHALPAQPLPAQSATEGAFARSGSSSGVSALRLPVAALRQSPSKGSTLDPSLLLDTVLSHALPAQQLPAQPLLAQPVVDGALARSGSSSDAASALRLPEEAAALRRSASSRGSTLHHPSLLLDAMLADAALLPQPLVLTAEPAPAESLPAESLPAESVPEEPMVAEYSPPAPDDPPACPMEPPRTGAPLNDLAGRRYPHARGEPPDCSGLMRQQKGQHSPVVEACSPRFLPPRRPSLSRQSMSPGSPLSRCSSLGAGSGGKGSTCFAPVQRHEDVPQQQQQQQQQQHGPNPHAQQRQQQQLALLEAGTPKQQWGKARVFKQTSPSAALFPPGAMPAALAMVRGGERATRAAAAAADMTLRAVQPKQRRLLAKPTLHSTSTGDLPVACSHSEANDLVVLGPVAAAVKAHSLDSHPLIPSLTLPGACVSPSALPPHLAASEIAARIRRTRPLAQSTGPMQVSMPDASPSPDGPGMIPGDTAAGAVALAAPVALGLRALLKPSGGPQKVTIPVIPPAAHQQLLTWQQQQRLRTWQTRRNAYAIALQKQEEQQQQQQHESAAESWGDGVRGAAEGEGEERGGELGVEVRDGGTGGAVTGGADRAAGAEAAEEAGGAEVAEGDNTGEGSEAAVDAAVAAVNQAGQRLLLMMRSVDKHLSFWRRLALASPSQQLWIVLFRRGPLAFLHTSLSLSLSLALSAANRYLLPFLPSPTLPASSSSSFSPPASPSSNLVPPSSPQSSHSLSANRILTRVKQPLSPLITRLASLLAPLYRFLSALWISLQTVPLLPLSTLPHPPKPLQNLISDLSTFGSKTLNLNLKTLNLKPFFFVHLHRLSSFLPSLTSAEGVLLGLAAPSLQGLVREMVAEKVAVLGEVQLALSAAAGQVYLSSAVIPAPSSLALSTLTLTTTISSSSSSLSTSPPDPLALLSTILHACHVAVTQASGIDGEKPTSGAGGREGTVESGGACNEAVSNEAGGELGGAGLVAADGSGLSVSTQGAVPAAAVVSPAVVCGQAKQLNEDVKGLEKLVSAVVARCQRPRHAARHWLEYLAGGLCGVAVGSWVVRHSRLNGSDDLNRWAADGWRAVTGFVTDHIWQPLSAISAELFHTFGDQQRGNVSMHDVQASTDSLRRMLLTFKDMANPLTHLLTGRLAEALLIQRHVGVGADSEGESNQLRTAHCPARPAAALRPLLPLP